MNNNNIVFFNVGTGETFSKIVKIEEPAEITEDESVARYILNDRTFTAKVQIDPVDWEKLDIMLRPYILYCNPKDEHLFEEYKKKGLIVRTDCVVKKGEYFVLDRQKEYEIWKEFLSSI